MGKCVCHLNGYELKDGKARQAIEEINTKLENLPTTSAGVTEARVDQMIRNELNSFNPIDSEARNNITTLNTQVEQIASEIEAPTDEEIDEIWGETPATEGISQGVSFRHYTVPANEKFTIKRNGYYMFFCNNAKLQLCESDGTAVIPNSDEGGYAKQIQVMTATLDSDPTSSNFAVGGMFWTGSSLLTSSVSTANRKADDGAYIIGTEEFTVYEMLSIN